MYTSLYISVFKNMYAPLTNRGQFLVRTWSVPSLLGLGSTTPTSCRNRNVHFFLYICL